MPYILICHKCGSYNPMTAFVCKYCGTILYQLGYKDAEGNVNPVYRDEEQVEEYNPDGTTPTYAG